MNSGETARQSNDAAALAASARQQVIWAAIAGAVMLYFGFTLTFADMSGPRLLAVTLQAGGCAMVFSALLLMSGKPFALLFDGVASMAIGVALAAAGMLFFVNIRTISISGLLDMVFGYFFVTSGLRSWREYTAFNPLMVGGDEVDDGVPGATAAPAIALPASEEPPRESHESVDPPEGFLASFAEPPDDDAEK